MAPAPLKPPRLGMSWQARASASKTKALPPELVQRIRPSLVRGLTSAKCSREKGFDGRLGRKLMAFSGSSGSLSISAIDAGAPPPPLAAAALVASAVDGYRRCLATSEAVQRVDAGLAALHHHVHKPPDHRRPLRESKAETRRLRRRRWCTERGRQG
ncbi:hypothetical protein U9M48_005622 [Paspalum notatum var. saurae]|uniref:Uncharacterized protein n=1 Tax=Paspalum notatum var. saurae TaxID=547442 RepID=A0AAQ3PQK4_PASNO